MSGSKTAIADEDRLDNVHPGDILREDLLIGSETDFAEVAEGTGIDIGALKEIVASCRDLDAAIDVRLARYFAMSPVGPGGWTGCIVRKQAREREQYQWGKNVPTKKW